MVRIAVVALVLLGACGAGTVTTSNVYYISTYQPGVFGYAAGGRDLRVIVTGNPTAAPREAFERAVTDAMQGKNWGPTTHFTTRPDSSARQDYWVSMIFGGDRYIGDYAICRGGGGRDIDPRSRPVRLQAAFCGGDRPLTSLLATVDDIASIDDPRLERVVAAAVVELFPLYDGTRDDDDCRRPLRKC